MGKVIGGVKSVGGKVLGGLGNVTGFSGPSKINMSAEDEAAFFSPKAYRRNKSQVAAAQKRLGLAVQGKGPSVAQKQLRQGLDESINSQLALSKSQPGVLPGLGARMASQNIGDLQLKTNQQSSVLRAQEQIAAEDMLRNYMQMGFDLDQAKVLANQERVKTKLGIAGQNVQSATTRQGAAIGAGSQLIGAMVGKG